MIVLASLLAAALAASAVVEPGPTSSAHAHESTCIHEQVQAETLHTTLSLDALAAAEQPQQQKRQAAATTWRP